MIRWQKVANDKTEIYRAEVPGGWLVWVYIGVAGGITFYPDPNHEWDGSSLP